MDCAKMCPQRKNFHRIKTARYGTNMPSAFHHMHQIIKPRTVRHGGCIKGDIAVKNLIHINKIAQRHGLHHTMCNFDPFGPSSRTGGVKEPSQIIRVA